MQDLGQSGSDTVLVFCGSQSVASYEDLSSSSFSSASRASLDARGSPTPSYGAENMMVFPGDSSGSI
ncbi:hypothetical protein ANTQUA_LOCUS4421 [Anthophora quadrimaculata]